jgi:hypothetical protein
LPGRCGQARTGCRRRHHIGASLRSPGIKIGRAFEDNALSSLRESAAFVATARGPKFLTTVSRMKLGLIVCATATLAACVPHQGRITPVSLPGSIRRARRSRRLSARRRTRSTVAVCSISRETRTAAWRNRFGNSLGLRSGRAANCACAVSSRRDDAARGARL